MALACSKTSRFRASNQVTAIDIVHPSSRPSKASLPRSTAEISGLIFAGILASALCPRRNPTSLAARIAVANTNEKSHSLGMKAII
jgi:hypothetical protein